MPNIIEITDLSAPELDIYARLTQAQLRSRLEPEKGIFIGEHVRDGDAHGWLLLVLIIGLLEGVNGCYRREAFAVSTII